MDEKNDGALEARPPTLEDFLQLCRKLNEKGVKYVVIGGMAIIQHGFVRATEDIDLLVDAGCENEERIKEALLYLPDQAIKDLNQGDIDSYTVVRIADEIVIDLMKSASGIDYEEASKSVVRIEIDDVRIPFATIELLWRMKQSIREKDRIDRMFLAEMMKKKDHE